MLAGHGCDVMHNLAYLLPGRIHSHHGNCNSHLADVIRQTEDPRRGTIDPDIHILELGAHRLVFLHREESKKQE